MGDEVTKLVKWLKEEGKVRFSTPDVEQNFVSFLTDCQLVDQTSPNKNINIIATAFSVFDRGITINGLDPSNGDKRLFKNLLTEAFDKLWSGSDNGLGKEREYVSITFEIAESELSHAVDYHAFVKHVDNVFEQYYLKDKDKPVYIAPYFVFVQSSGMGKTKLLFHYVQNSRKEKNQQQEGKDGLRACLILCRAQRNNADGDEGKVFDSFFDANHLV
jgi:hypothetical protein